MKKIIMLVVCFMLISVFAFADCSIKTGTIKFEPTIDAPAVINYQTGEGYCSLPSNPGGVILDFTKCDNVADLVPGGNYIIVQKILTDGFKFVVPSEEATPISFAVKAFTSMDDLCADNSGVTVNLTYTIVNDNIVRSEISNEFILSLHPYLLVEFPNFTYTKDDVVDDAAYAEVGIINADAVCVTCEAAICKSTVKLGDISCLTKYSLLFPYCLCGDPAWWSGIAITNLTNEKGSMDITVYVDGKAYTTTYDVSANAVFTILVDDLVNTVVIDNTECYVKVNSNFEMDGVGIYGNSQGHSAYLARK